MFFMVDKSSTISTTSYTNLTKKLQLIENLGISSFQSFTPFLFPIRNHPSLTKNYFFLLEKSSQFSKLIIFSKKVIYTFSSYLYTLLLAAKAFRSPIMPSEAAINNFDCIILSHKINSTNTSSFSDFYFPGLSSQLKENKLTPITFLIDHSHDRYSDLTLRTYSELTPNVLILPPILPFWPELKVRLYGLWCFILSIYLTYKDFIYSPYLYLSLYLSYFSNGFLLNMRRHILLSSLKSNRNVRYFYTTYEGHNFERSSYYSLKHAFPSIKFIAYQHAPLFFSQSGVFETYEKLPNPNTILCCGDYSCELFKKSLKFTADLVVVGSIKCTSLIQSKHFSEKILESTHLNQVLVLPEALDSEVIRLFEYSLTFAKLNHMVRVVFRLHPATNPTQLKLLNFRIGCTKNFSISSSTLEDDIKNSCICFYRGSSAVLQACQHQLLPVFIGSEAELSIDPLYGIQTNRPSSSNPSDSLAKFVSYFSCAKIESLSLHCDNLLKPLNYRPMFSLLTVYK